MDLRFGTPLLPWWFAIEVLAWAGRESYVAQLPAASRPLALEVRALLATFLDELPGGLSRAGRRYGDGLLALPELAPVDASDR